MYEVDDKDRVVELTNVLQSSVGAPTPVVLAGEHDLFLTYYLQDTPEDWDGTNPRSVGMDTEDKPVAIVTFKACQAHMFGPPNDEAFDGHPLYERGLRPYGVFEIEDSSWIRKLERMNAVHPSHDKEWFMKDLKHFVFSFHDSTFECISEGFCIETFTGSVSSMVPRMLKALRE